ncbi:MAG: hypothetical protein ACRDTX_22760 [Pseudonocardiaceae bacterium]
MAELLGYGRGWNPLLDDILEQVTERTAKRRHDNGTWYAAVYDDGFGRAVVGLKTDDGNAKVDFWGPGARQHRLVHHFSTVDDQLFVIQITRFGHDPSQDLNPGRDFNYSDDFRWKPGEPARWVRHADVQPYGELARREEWDPGPHRFVLPDFGNYEYLLDPTLLDRLWPGHDRLPATATQRSS